MMMCYRMTVYSGIYSDNTNTTVLTPATAASHSDPFKVCTISGVSGFQPFMNPPRGKRGSLSVPEQKRQVGNYTVELLDKRTGDGNINRWVTSFFGNDTGKFTLIGKKAYIEESVDGGATWNPFFVGQVSSVNLSNPLVVSLVIKDNVQFLKEPIFKTHPRVDYALYKNLVPVGLNRDVKNENGEVVLQRPAGLDCYSAVKESYLFGDSLKVTISSESRNNPRNMWSMDTQFYSGASRVTRFTFDQGFPVRAIIEVNGTPYLFGVVSVSTPNNSAANNNTTPIDMIELWLLPPWTPGAALSFSGIPTGYNLSGVKVWMFKYEGTSDKNGFWLQGEWDQVLKDVLDGAFYEPVKVMGADVMVARQTSYNATNLSDIAGSIPRPSFYVNKSVPAVDWLEKYMFAPYSVGYTMEPVLENGVPVCRMRVFSTAQPSSLSGLRTISGDVVKNTLPDWGIEQPVSFVAAKYYEEYETRVTENSSENSQGDSDYVRAVEHSVVAVNSTDGDIVLNSDTNKVELDMNGVRAFVPLSAQTVDYYGVQPQTYTRTRAEQFVSEVFHRFKSGISTVVLQTLRNADTNAMTVGDYVLVEVEVLPNQATHTRGGTRLMQILNKCGTGIWWEFELLDSGVNEVMAPPTVGIPSTPNRSEVQVSITTSERAMVDVQYAVGVTQPSGDSRLWTAGVQQLIDSTTSTVSLSGLPENRKIWVRARCISPVDESLKMSSQYVVGGSVVLNNIPAPSSVTVDDITSHSATVHWVNTNPSLSIQLFLASPAGTPDTLIAQLSAGSTSYVLRGLDKNSSSSHRVGVRYYEQYQGTGAFATADFIAAGDAIQLDAPAAILIYNR